MCLYMLIKSYMSSLLTKTTGANLRLPRHSGHWDTKETCDSDDTNDPDVIGSVHHNSTILLEDQRAFSCV